MSNGTAAALADQRRNSARTDRLGALLTIQDGESSRLGEALRAGKQQHCRTASYTPGTGHGRIDRLKPAEGTVVRHMGSEYAVARDESGRLHAVSARCTHMGCRLSLECGRDDLGLRLSRLAILP